MRDDVLGPVSRHFTKNGAYLLAAAMYVCTLYLALTTWIVIGYRRPMSYKRLSLLGNSAIQSGRGFGNKPEAKKPKEQGMIDDIRAALIERPKEEALHFNLGLLLLSGSTDGELDEAAKRQAMMSFQNSIMLNPERIGSWYNLAVLYDEFNEKSKAIDAYDKVLELTSSEEEHLRVAAYTNKMTILTNQGNLEAAAKISEIAVKEFPNSSALWCSMGVVLRMDRNVEWATKAFENALACCDGVGGNANQDENLLAILNNLGAVYAAVPIYPGKENIKANQAVEIYERALGLAPNDLSTLYGLGILRRDLGHTDLARTCFEKAAAISPHDRQISFQLALLDREDGRKVEMECAPSDYVATLFDYYASNNYDEHLLSLEYKGPELLWKAFELSDKYQGLGDDRGKLMNLKVLEIGCGSGLVGKYFRSRGVGYNFEGCDLSPIMTKMATDAIFIKPDDPSNVDMVYSKVECVDAVSFLQGKRGETVDMVLGGDVLCYFGSLDDLFEAVAGSLVIGGVFMFTTEKMNDAELLEGSDGEGFVLRSSGRFAHSEEYIRATTDRANLHVQRCERAILRMNNGEPVEGLVFTASVR